jgi:hypothetical protein
MNKTIITLLLFFIGINSYSQKIDTLFIKYDEHFLTKKINPINKEIHYLILDKDKKEDLVYFLEIETFYDLNPVNVKTLKSFLKEADALTEIGGLRDFQVVRYKYKSNYKECILVKKDQFIKVRLVYEIE